MWPQLQNLNSNKSQSSKFLSDFQTKNFLPEDLSPITNKKKSDNDLNFPKNDLAIQ